MYTTSRMRLDAIVIIQVPQCWAQRFVKHLQNKTHKTVAWEYLVRRSDGKMSPAGKITRATQPLPAPLNRAPPQLEPSCPFTFELSVQLCKVITKLLSFTNNVELRKLHVQLCKYIVRGEHNFALPRFTLARLRQMTTIFSGAQKVEDLSKSKHFYGEILQYYITL